MDEKDELGLPTVRVLLRVERALSSFHHDRSIAASWQRELLDFALEHARGCDGRLFLPRTKFGQTLERACARAGIPRCTPNDLRRTYSTWLRADGVPNELSEPTMGHKDTRMLDRVYARLPPELLRVRLLAALGRCSAGAVNTSGEGAQNGRIGQQVDDLTAEKLAPGSGRRSNLEIQPEVRQARTRTVASSPFGHTSLGCLGSSMFTSPNGAS